MINDKNAMKKICPVISAGQDEYHCVAGECMAWRWSFNEENKGFCVMLSSQISIRNKKDFTNKNSNLGD